MTKVIPERAIIYSVAGTEGAVLGAFCGSVSILLGRHQYELSAGQYGALFVPQIVTAVAAALIAVRSARHLPRGRMLRVGLALNVGSLLLLTGALAPANRAEASFPLLLAASGIAGAGLGCIYPSLLKFGLDFNPMRPERSVLALNLMVAVGLAVSPAVELGGERAGVWWALEAALCVLNLLLIAVATNARLGPDARRTSTLGAIKPHLSGWHKVYPFLALLAGACAIMLTAWVQVRQHGHVTSHPGLGVLALAAFWAAFVTLARVVFAAADRRQTWQRTAGLVPFVLAAVVTIIGLAIDQNETAEVGMVLLAALVCAAFVPLPVNPVGRQVILISLVLSAGLLGSYPLGVGIAGPLISGVGVDSSAFGPMLWITGVLGITACLFAAVLPIWRYAVPDRVRPAGQPYEVGPIPAADKTRSPLPGPGTTSAGSDIPNEHEAHPTGALARRQDRPG